MSRRQYVINHYDKPLQGDVMWLLENITFAAAIYCVNVVDGHEFKCVSLQRIFSRYGVPFDNLVSVFHSGYVMTTVGS